MNVGGFWAALHPQCQEAHFQFPLLSHFIEVPWLGLCYVLNKNKAINYNVYDPNIATLGTDREILETIQISISLQLMF